MSELGTFCRERDGEIIGNICKVDGRTYEERYEISIGLDSVILERFDEDNAEFVKRTEIPVGFEPRIFESKDWKKANMALKSFKVLGDSFEK